LKRDRAFHLLPFAFCLLPSVFCLLPSAFCLLPSAWAFAPSVAAQVPAGAAYFVRHLSNPRDRREARPDVLDAPTLPGSVMKMVTLVTALEAGTITPETGAMCRRIVTADGVRFTCAHPDLKRPLTAAEALAHSCNDFFVSLAPRLSRDRVNATRLAAGLPPLSSSVRLAPALVGLDGPRVSARALVDVMARLAGVGPDPAVPMRPATKAVLLEGLTGAAVYGTAAALGERGVRAWAKTGTASMPGGGVAGLLVALVPAPQPTHGIVVMAPGAAGMDAAAIAADLVTAHAGSSSQAAAPQRAPDAQARRGVGPGGVPPAVVALPPSVRLGRLSASGRAAIETMSLDDYIAQVLAGEGQPSAGTAAQQALAITARTFALANLNRHRREGFDVCDTTHCQVLKRATTTTRDAAIATSGQVLLFEGRPAPVFYSASCGGRLERASQVWPGSSDLAQPDRDDADADEPAWVSEVRAGDLERALRAAGLRGGQVRGLRVIQRNQSGRVVRLRVDGFSPPEISGNDLRMAVGRVLGWQLMKSTAFDVDRTGSGYRFRGRGHGHGVGLCVIGAGVRASRGADAAAILRFYFPSLRVGPVPAPQLTGPSAQPVAAVGEGTGTVKNAKPADVRIALPAGEEAGREALMTLIRAARDSVSMLTGQKAPPVLTVTVHPTVESFGRATGQPWWASGATVGTEIALLPVTMLRQQGQLERTVRHEVAHALLDQALAGRPMWVREGAAIYFERESEAARREPGGGSRESGLPADAAAKVGARRRITCPTDDELLRPISAGAQREAYERAEACFSREMASGKRWSDVK
jgi:SpoIID/LytB domain protein